MYDKCKNFDLVTVTHKGNGHYQIRGKVLVNHYPNSKKRIAYVAGTNEGIKGVTPCQSIRLALDPDLSPLNKTKRMKSYKAERLLLWEKSKICAICGKPIVDFVDATLDHKIPLSKGGLNNRNNYQLAHKKCNQDKGSDI